MSDTTRPGPGRRRIVFAVLALLLVIGAGYAAFAVIGQGDTTTESDIVYSLVRPQRGEMSATVNASGSMQPREVVDLNFATPGLVIRVLVDVGETVERGDVLAKLDTRELDLQVEQARASLSQAEATYEQLLAGATEEEIAQANAQLEQARAQYQQTRGAVTQEEIEAARLQLEEAQARLARLEAGADQEDITAAQARLDQARASLQSQRDSLSAAKTRAQSQMELAANALRDRQAEYSRVYWNIREVERELNTVDQELWQDQKDREEQALRQVQNAEQELEQARIAYEEAQQAEITGIQQAEAEVRNAEAALDDLLQGTDPDELAAARAEVGRARANLSQLQGEERSGSLAAAQAGVDNALSSLEQLTTEPREVDVASALAQIRQAEVSLELAQLDVQKATLRAPINATVAEVNLKVGEEPDTAQPDIVLADLSSFYVDVTVDEIDVANLELAQPVNLTLDALPELELSGLVETISPLSSAESAVTSYNVRIETQADNPRVRSGMSANADIVVAQKDDALIVPRRAVYSDQGALFVDVPTDQALCAAERETWPAVPELEAVEIEAGLRNDFSIEVLSDDIDEQTCVYVEGFDARLNPLGGPPPGHRRSR